MAILVLQSKPSFTVTLPCPGGNATLEQVKFMKYELG